MVGCIVLSDSAVQDILIGQSKDETMAFLGDIRRCLIDYSTSKEREYQPGSSAIVRPSGQKTLFRPFTSPTNVGCKIIVSPAPAANGKADPLHGVLVVTDEKGLNAGLINAEEVTAYRTSMASMIPFVTRDRVRNIVVFGAGKQALWHIRLALILQGDAIGRVTVIHRSRESGEKLLDRLRTDNDRRWKLGVEFASVHADESGHQNTEQIKSLLAHADVIFCTVPSTEPLFGPECIQQRSLEERGMPLISAIGSWQPDMIEIHPQLIKHAVNDPKGQGLLLVDDRIGCLNHAGEVIQCGLQSEQLVELGELGGKGLDGVAHTRKIGGEAFERWLGSGLVIYKSVGVSIMDLTAGQRLLTLAREKGFGTILPDF